MTSYPINRSGKGIIKVNVGGGAGAGGNKRAKSDGRKILTLERYLKNHYGVGWSRANQLANELGYLRSTPVDRISKEAQARFENYLRIEKGRRDVRLQRVKLKVKVGTYAGIRMRRGLPSRGQHTQTNASTAGRLNISRTILLSIYFVTRT